MKPKILAITLATIFLICFSVIVITYSSSIIKTDEIYTDLIISEKKVGSFAIDKNNIRFGRMASGNIAEREFDVLTDVDIFVIIKVTGSIGPFVSISDNKFLITQNETKRIKLTAYTPEGTPEGNYSGYVVVYYHKPWVEKFIKWR